MSVLVAEDASEVEGAMKKKEKVIQQRKALTNEEENDESKVRIQRVFD